MWTILLSALGLESTLKNEDGANSFEAIKMLSSRSGRPSAVSRIERDSRTAPATASPFDLLVRVAEL